LKHARLFRTLVPGRPEGQTPVDQRRLPNWGGPAVGGYRSAGR